MLAAAMLEDVLAALAGAVRLAGILVNTTDPAASALAGRYGARVVTKGRWTVTRAPCWAWRACWRARARAPC